MKKYLFILPIITAMLFGYGYPLAAANDCCAEKACPCVNGTCCVKGKCTCEGKCCSQGKCLCADGKCDAKCNCPKH